MAELRCEFFRSLFSRAIKGYRWMGFHVGGKLANRRQLLLLKKSKANLVIPTEAQRSGGNGISASSSAPLRPATLSEGSLLPFGLRTARPAISGRSRIPSGIICLLLFLLEHLSGVGINVGKIAGLFVPPQQEPDGRLKPVGIPKRKG